MTDRIDEAPPLSIPEQAAEWLLRWHCGDLNIAERYEYLQWLKTSPVHIAETLRMCRLHSWLQGTTLERFLTNEDAFSNVVELPAREVTGSGQSGTDVLSLWKIRIAAGVAAIAVSAMLAIVVKIVWLDHTLRTQASEWRSVSLSDGSSISAAPYTRIRHDIDDDQRIITLAQGSAVFHVARDPARPFVVAAGAARVTATGTQFGVEREADRLTVTVKEGSVTVSSAPDGDVRFAAVPLTEHQQLTVSRTGETSVTRVDVEEALDWSNRRLEFRAAGTTIGDAVARFNKYNRIKIEVDEALASQPFRGGFDANDVTRFAGTVQEMTKGTLVRERRDLWRVRAAPSGP